jgi:hypothetical protein
MSPRFPSLDFLQQLQKRSEEDPPQAAPGTPGDALIGLDLDGHPFMIEFEDGVCVAAALGGTPTDLDFTLAAPRDVWLDLFERIGSDDPAGGHPLAEMVGADGPIRLETLQEDGAERFAQSRDSLAAFFDGTKDVQLD